jgi:hypothetical protein
MLGAILSQTDFHFYHRRYMMKRYKEIDEAAVVACFENSLEPVESIARRFGVRYTRIMQIAHEHLSDEFLRERKRQCYSVSKQADKNPMWGIESDKHPRYKGEVSDGKGYVMVLKPDWFTGRRGSKHVFKHTVVMCEALGLTELPRGFVVHHIDGDPTNNDIHNLALVTVNGHSRVHSLEVQRLAEMRRELATSEAHRIYRARRKDVTGR